MEFNQSCENEETVPENWVPCEQYICVRKVDNKIVGMIQFRHHFNKYGGNMGYSVRPEERRKGAKQTLVDCLKICKANGLKDVLITCILEDATVNLYILN